VPGEPIDAMVAAGGSEAAGLAAEIGEGLICTAPDPELVEGYAWRRSRPHLRPAHRRLGSVPGAREIASRHRLEPTSGRL
jgi:hypothetical protein